MQGKRKAIADTGGDNGDGGGAGGYGGNTRGIGPLPRRRRIRSFPPPFLMKTFDMIEDPETNSIISWSPNSTSFTIWDQIKFTAELLPKNFRHGNFSSFVYQLNNYGFKKISWDKFEYENPWFQAGKRHLLKHIKRRNQQCEYDSVIQPSCGSTDNLLKDRMEDQLETLMIEQHGLKVELEKLNEKQKQMVNHFNKIEESIKVSEREKEEMVSQLLVQVFIQKLREKREMSKYEATKNQELDNSTRKEILELVAEGNCSRHIDKNKQVQEEVMVIQTEGQTFCPPDNSGGSNQEKKATATSETYQNRDFWKKMIEDGSEHENGGHEELEEYHPKAILKLQDLIASNTLVQGENQEEKPVTVMEDQDGVSENMHLE
ncbi:heat stress transcription factor A-7a-like [Coffea eugenioides]|uniref:heat stress transcription factor A-7a-like n=1 Tax=Coffea eugenioides TaxID=49369 RepID=UPI000F611F53|nr:heat stress transcription factor A-7a-like [Coffea eugenioides]